MYRLKNLNRIFKISLCFISTFCLIGTCFSGEINLTPLNFLNKRVDTAQKNIEQNSSKGEAIVKNLYSNSLKQADLLKMSPMLTSVKDTTKSLNDTYLCNLKDNDTINILYKSNDEFRKNLKNASSNFDKPTKNDMVNSCGTFMGCVLTGSDSNTIVDTVSYCKMIVNDFYLSAYKTNYNSSSLSKGNEGLEAFWNKSLNDSSYDILNDVYILAKILFELPEEPEETLFYEMPDVSTTVNNIDTYTEIINIIKDRFSPYITIETGSNSEGSGDNGLPSGSNGGNGTNNQEPGNGVVVNGYLDDEFLENSTTVTPNRGSSNGYDYLGQNENCLDLNDEPTTPDPENPENPTNPGGNNPENPDNPENPTNPGNNPENPDNPENPTNPGDNPEFSGDEETLTCFASCEDIPCTATSCDRIACYAQCLCLTYESDVFDPTKTPGLGPVFKLKFCLQPVQDGKVTTSKKVHNLESVVKEINTVVQNLRNSGELMLNKKTKEFLDAGFQKNDFSKQISFSIDGFAKAPQAKKSEKQEKEEQESLNIALMESILGFEKDPTVESAGRDKYVIKGGKQEGGSVGQTKTQNKSGGAYIDSSAFVSSLQSEHLTDMGSEVGEFLYANINFWISVKESLVSIDNVAKALLDKK